MAVAGDQVMCEKETFTHIANINARKNEHINYMYREHM